MTLENESSCNMATPIVSSFHIYIGISYNKYNY